ncbi:hypothetical protein H8S33_18135 [Ornithinibacillus sp. BX22]|uniref:Uncharacterized protein n=1 Tax=Ornithinibacillus hominis TaxID=2763055 RepID=A0A923L976_9BACI|nr:hypothetical protein [Ornithinibacillus hominis]MBC5638695.1 hypothetical protein [Ornithinibacillus hominis]
MSGYDSTLKSLLEFLSFNEEDVENIFDFVYLESTDAEDFLESFEIKDEHLFDKDVELVSLHSTTSIDKCKSIKELGIINLQDAVSRKTPLMNFLSEKEIHINVKEKYILYKGNKIEIFEKTNGFSLTDKEKFRNRVIHKIYGDFQINGFLCHSNVVSYGGYTRDRPEILFDLAQFLSDPTIESDWVKNKDKEHFIIKFKQPLNNYKYWTFEVEYEDNYYGITKDNLNYLPNEVIEVKVKRWLIQKSLYILRYGVYELFSYVHPKVNIEPKDIIEIMSEKEYIDRYKIEGNS